MGCRSQHATMRRPIQSAVCRLALWLTTDSLTLAPFRNKPTDEVKAALEQPSQQRSIEPEAFAPLDFAKSCAMEHVAPLLGRPVCIAQRHAVADIADPVHQAKPFVTEPCSRETVSYTH